MTDNHGTSHAAEGASSFSKPRPEPRYRCFTRTWWINNPSWPNGLEPGAGKRRYRGKRNLTETEARAYCRQWNDTHKPGRYSLKCEFEEMP